MFDVEIYYYTMHYIINLKMSVVEKGETYGFWDQENNVFYEFPTQEAFHEFMQWLNLSLENSDYSFKPNYQPENPSNEIDSPRL